MRNRLDTVVVPLTATWKQLVGVNRQRVALIITIDGTSQGYVSFRSGIPSIPIPLQNYGPLELDVSYVGTQLTMPIYAAMAAGKTGNAYVTEIMCEQEQPK